MASLGSLGAVSVDIRAPLEGLDKDLKKASKSVAESLEDTGRQFGRVGTSFAPNAMDGIAESFARLPSVMVDPAVDAARTVGETFEEVGSVIEDNLTSALGRNIESWDDLRDAAVSAIKQIILDLLKLEGTLENGKSLLGGFVDILVGAFSGAAGSGAAGTSSIGAGGLSSVETIGITALAHGGRATAGDPFIVGEQGPELFVPEVSGAVVPHSQLIATPEEGPGGAVTINMPLDLRGAEPGVFAKAEVFKRRVKAEIKAEIFDDINRGGSAAKLVGRR